MFQHCLFVVIALPIVLSNAQNNNNSTSASGINVDVVEHQPNNHIPSSNPTTITERTLIRVTRLNTKVDQAKPQKRTRRQIVEAIQTAGFVIGVAKAIHNTESGEEILGMAKKVAIAVIVIVSLCIVCCLITTVVICVKCCCGGNDRKRNRGQSAAIQVPQPIFVHTGPAGYQPQYFQQQAPSAWNPTVVQNSEVSPMLPAPSAPPRPQDFYPMEHPPPAYEKLYTKQ